MINPLLECFFVTEDNAALDRNPGPGCNNLHLRLIPGELYSACPHRQFQTLPSLFYTARLHCETPTLMPACHAWGLGLIYNMFYALNIYVNLMDFRYINNNAYIYPHMSMPILIFD